MLGWRNGVRREKKRAENCYEEGSVRGAFSSRRIPSDPAVHRKRRGRKLPAFRVLRQARERRYALVRPPLSPKLSRSLFNTAIWVCNPVPFEPRKEPVRNSGTSEVKESRQYQVPRKIAFWRCRLIQGQSAPRRCRRHRIRSTSRCHIQGEVTTRSLSGGDGGRGKASVFSA